MIDQNIVLLLLGSVALGVGIGLMLERRRVARYRGSAEEQARALVAAAEKEADALKRAAELSGREELQRLRDQWREEADARRAEIDGLERRAAKREESLDRKLAALEERQERLDERRDRLEAAQERVEQEAARIEQRERAVEARLEKLSGLSRDEARRQLMSQIEDQARAEAAQRVREIKESARRDAEREARNVISMAIQRLAVDHSSETTVSVVALPSDDMKGRIIGREGRNIRSFEAATGVDVVVDDTPEAVILSCFDPVRREIARMTMERLVADGRIHPGRIEEMAAKASEDVKASMREAAEEVLYELGIHDLHPQLIETLGRLKYRTSYGQNQLMHSREVALISANMAAELGLDVATVKRMGILHDVGKGLTHDHEGSHVELGYDLCKRYGEGDPVLNAIRAHHGDEPARYPETFLVTAADAISGARPGARRESFEHYVKRLEKLEEIAGSCEGVEKVYAIQAGREIRIMVTPDKVSDEDMAALSENTARRIENELQYPGQIKVVVVREARAVDFAR
ncbi:MAG: ribonuclease Y [Gemmatimonadota bacterium]